MKRHLYVLFEKLRDEASTFKPRQRLLGSFATLGSRSCPTLGGKAGISWDSALFRRFQTAHTILRIV
ncbi:MAG TPA: hypothetical protein PL188_02525 [Candidatus Cloacimonadota bacterium]|nr:hypothetical protein [Candidatus Cloacimonadota bacterium]